jgi:glycosyltransferase involved in cell wall biosynthesis
MPTPGKRHPKFDVLVVGSLGDHDINMAESFSRVGLSVAVARTPICPMFNVDALAVDLRVFSPANIFIVRSVLEFWRLVRSSGAIFTITGTLPSFFRHLYPISMFLPLPPIFNLATGSDLVELAHEKSLPGWVYRRLLKKAVWNIVAPCPLKFDAVASLKIKNMLFSRYPYGMSDPRPGLANGKEIVYLHLSNLDWGEADQGNHRRSTKNTDRFLRAFMRAAGEGAPIRCIILDRGPDRAAARKLITSCGCADRFEWRQQVLASELPALMQDADIVVDQFETGCAGGITIEAMAQAKPVMTYIDGEAYRLFYDTMPPILNCRTEDQIFGSIMGNLQREALLPLGQRARDWVTANHRDQHDVRELAMRIRLAANEDWRQR